MSDRALKVIAGGVLVGAAFLLGPGGLLATPLLGHFGAALVASAGLGLARSGLTTGVVSRQTAIEINRCDPQSALPIVYGTARLGIQIVDRQVDPANTNDLYIVGALCVGPDNGQGIAGIDEIYFDNRLAFTAAGAAVNDVTREKVNGSYVTRASVTKYLGTDSQAVDPTLHAQFPASWPTSSAGKGIAYVVLKLTKSPNFFLTGVPNITCVVRGQKVFDPRTSATAFTTTPALCLRDYLASARYGCGCATSEINDTALGTEANYQDSTVTVPDPWPASGTRSQPHHTANGFLDGNATLQQNLQQLLTAARAELIYQSGQFRSWTRRTVTPSSVTLDESTLIGDWSFGVPGRRTKKNLGQATYIDPARNWQAETKVWPRNGATNSFLTADQGVESPLALELPFTNDPYLAEQLLMVQVRESRTAQIVAVTATEAALQLQIGDVVAITHRTPGWSGKLFWVAGLVLLPNGTVRLTGLAYDANAYSLDSQSQYVGSSGSNLPNPYVCAAPSGLMLTCNSTTALRLANGQAQSRLKIGWTASPDPYLRHYLVRYRVTGATNWAILGYPGPTEVEVYLPAASDVSYDIELSAENTLGAQSDRLTATLRTDTPGGLADYGANLVVNGDASQGEAGQAAPGWTNSNGNAVTIATDAARFGDRALKITNATAVDSQNYQEFTVPDGAYRLSGWIKTTALPSSDAGKGACLNINKISGTGTFTLLERIGDEFTTDEPDVGLLADDAAHDWTFVSSTFVVSGGGMTLRAYVQLGHTAGQSGTAWFAGVRLTRVDQHAIVSFLDSWQLDPKTMQNDGAQKRPLVKGLQSGTARDGDHITFLTPFQDPPKVTVSGGANIEPNSANWSVPASYNNLQRHYDDAKGINVTAAGFDVWAKLRQPGTATARTNSFPVGTLSSPGDTKSVTLADAPSRDNGYVVTIGFTMTLSSKYATPVTGTLKWAVDVDTGSGFVQQAVRSVSLSTTSVTDDVLSDSDFFNLAGLYTSTTVVRVRFVSFTVSGTPKNPTSCVIDPNAVTYATASDITASKTPLTSDYVTWRAEGVV